MDTSESVGVGRRGWQEIGAQKKHNVEVGENGASAFTVSADG